MRRSFRSSTYIGEIYSPLGKGQFRQIISVIDQSALEYYNVSKIKSNERKQIKTSEEISRPTEQTIRTKLVEINFISSLICREKFSF